MSNNMETNVRHVIAVRGAWTQMFQDPQSVRDSVIRNMAVKKRKICLSLYRNCDSTAIRLRHDYDEKLTFIFARVESRRMKAGGS